VLSRCTTGVLTFFHFLVRAFLIIATLEFVGASLVIATLEFVGASLVIATLEFVGASLVIGPLFLFRAVPVCVLARISRRARRSLGPRWSCLWHSSWGSGAPGNK
jgi:hypothetical protein